MTNTQFCVLLAVILLSRHMGRGWASVWFGFLLFLAVINHSIMTVP